jgi:hypothetical protein
VQDQSRQQTKAQPEEWLLRLKHAYDAGYYRTEADVKHQEQFPWQNKICKHCPFWSNSICQVYVEYRSANAHACSYFDEPNHAATRAVIQEREKEGYRRW